MVGNGFLQPFVSATHCASGCVVGDLIGAPIVFFAGRTAWGDAHIASRADGYEKWQ